MKGHIANTRRHLGELDGLASKTETSERRILGQAERRLEAVSAMIERQRPGVEGAKDAAQDRYLELVQERAQLQTVIAKSKRALSM